MPAATKGKKKRAEEAAALLLLSATASASEEQQEAPAKKAKTTKGKAKPEVVIVTERDPLPAKPALPSGKGFKVGGLRLEQSETSGSVSAVARNVSCSD